MDGHESIHRLHEENHLLREHAALNARMAELELQLAGLRGEINAHAQGGGHHAHVEEEFGADAPEE